jgi:superfamily II DNA or RNA helicase
MKELSEDFTFLAPNYQYDPRYKRRVWDGKIRLINQRGMIYAGLQEHLAEWTKNHSYTIDYNKYVFSANTVHSSSFLNSYKSNLEPRDYQTFLIQKCLEQGRAVVVSPTGSGKSFVIHELVKYYWTPKTLIIVPTINLVNQMYNDFKSYGMNVENFCHKVWAGVDPQADKLITITTWQSLMDMPPEFFEQFKVVIGDECHGFKAKSLIHIMTQLVNAKIRFGFTATLSNDIMCHELALEGLFGPIIKGETTKQLQDQGHLAEVEIVTLVLEYPKEDRRKAKGMTYNDEQDFLVAHEDRQTFIRNLALGLVGSSFVLFRLVDKHGQPLFDKLATAAPDRVRFVYGGTEAADREEVRIEANNDDNLIVVASYGVFAGGVNVPNLRNIVFASPYKSKIKVLQSIGRALRRTDQKQHSVIYDIIDDLSSGSYKNYGVRHYIDRVRLYNQERFPYKIYRIPLK